ncbi:MAG: acyl-ACP--UDP-N-acetylglucosamine O-acyltransferase [Fibrobacterales bacterium]
MEKLPQVQHSWQPWYNVIHPTAIVSPLAQLGQGISIGPYSIIEDGVTIGDRTTIASHVHLYSNTTIGNNCSIYDGAIVGSNPQDLSYLNETTFLTIGNNTIIREYCTINRAANEGKSTSIGNNVLLMAYSHVGHDSIIEDHVVIANGVQLGGHVELGFGVVIGGMTAIQQFCRIGTLAFVGGTLKADKDVPPFSKALGNPLSWAGLNHKALEKHAMSKEDQEAIHKAYRTMYRSGKTVEEALTTIKASYSKSAIESMLSYFSKPTRGIIRPKERA